jgi:MoaA/NifB/PqqE/SkfB family radical SAM enzyme
MPKVSSFPYTEGPCKFGCGAGVLHSYITATGDLWPCDFIPCRFGNVVDEGLKEVYGRMMAVAGTPKNHCVACTMAGQFQGKSLPLDLKQSQQFCQSCHSRAYPQFFKDLQKP